MPFPWLPDAELDPHPRLTWLTECCFDLAVLALFRKEEILPPSYQLDAGTLVVSNHQRDADVPILTTVLCRREGLAIRWPLPFYATREDIFRSGFLADLLAEWPHPLPQLLGRIPLRWLFRIVRAEPMRRVREFTFGETVSALVADGGADADPHRVLAPRGLRETRTRLGEVPPRLGGLTPARLGALRRAFWGLRRVRGTALRGLAPEFRATIDAQLERFAALLDAGRIVYFAPEGTISARGDFGRIRAGTWRVYRLAQSPPPVRALALSYDPLGPGRLRVVVRIGEAMRDLDARERRPFDARLRREILKLYAVTPSHLLSRFLATGPGRFASHDFARWLQDAAAAAAAAGLTLDPLLAAGDREELAERRLEWCRRAHLLERSGRQWRSVWPPQSQPGWRGAAAQVRYLHTALDNVLEVAPELGRRLAP